MEYTTQLDAAKKKIITKEMKRVAEKENIDVEILREKVEKGYVVIPNNEANRLRKGRKWGFVKRNLRNLRQTYDRRN